LVADHTTIGKELYLKWWRPSGTALDRGNTLLRELCYLLLLPWPSLTYHIIIMTPSISSKTGDSLLFRALFTLQKLVDSTS